MGIEALTHRDDGTVIAVPESHDDWQQWVSAGRTRNWMLHDPLLDWLEIYGEGRGYQRDDQTEDYCEALDFLPFIFRQGRAFEEGILRLLQERYPVTVIASNGREIRELAKAQETFSAMQQGVPIIHQAVLWDAQNMTYGAPDFLVRSDVLHELFPNDIAEHEAHIAAKHLGGVQWHYRVVDTKFTTLHLGPRDGLITNDGSGPAYKAQLYIYNQMLERLQGYSPLTSYLLGRGWQVERTVARQRVVERGANALARLGPVLRDGNVANRIPIATEVERALAWIRRVRTEGCGWQLTPVPSVAELYPNMKGPDYRVSVDENHPEPEADVDDGVSQDWGSLKKWLANQLKELTLLPNVGAARRREGHDAGICKWDNPKLTPATVGVTGGQQGPTLQRFLEVNTRDGPLVLPSHIDQDRDVWHTTPALEFYVDFEFCSDLNDDFSNLPEKGGQPLIFMIGCGHLENEEWQFRLFVTDNLSEYEELRIIREWVEHMQTVQLNLDPETPRPRIMHWSHAETTQLEGPRNSDMPNNSARHRHGGRADWPDDLNWYDFLSKVVQPEGVAVKDAWGFGLKSVASAMRKHGMIDTDWADSPVDGLGAMVGAWRCDGEARKKGTSMAEEPLMKDIADYNEVDCRVMMEIIRYLRSNH